MANCLGQQNLPCDPTPHPGSTTRNRVSEAGPHPHGKGDLMEKNDIRRHAIV